MLQYVMHTLVENLCTKFHFIQDNRIVEISGYNVTVAPLVGTVVCEWYTLLQCGPMYIHVADLALTSYGPISASDHAFKILITNYRHGK